jgi:hypothetical protein
LRLLLLFQTASDRTGDVISAIAFLVSKERHRSKQRKCSSGLKGALFAYFNALRHPSWYQRMSGFGSHEREDAKIEVAWEALKDESTEPLPDTSDSEPLARWVGGLVEISAGSADRGSASGRLLAVDHEQVVLAVQPIPGESAQVWFPRFGYHLKQCF